MDRTNAIVSHPLWQAAKLMDDAIIAFENRSGVPWLDGFEDIAELLTASWDILINVAGSEDGKKQIGKAIEAIDLSMSALAPLRGQWKLINGHTESLDLGDIQLEIGDCFPRETREEWIAKDAKTWLGCHGKNLRIRASRLRIIPLQLASTPSETAPETNSDNSQSENEGPIRTLDELKSVAYRKHPNLSENQMRGLLDRAVSSGLIANVGHGLWRDMGWDDHVEKYHPRGPRSRADDDSNDEEDLSYLD